ncbi:uncharacterized protein LOC132663107 isoform X2 [Panthera onca]
MNSHSSTKPQNVCSMKTEVLVLFPDVSSVPRTVLGKSTQQTAEWKLREKQITVTRSFSGAWVSSIAITNSGRLGQMRKLGSRAQRST